MNKTRQNEYLKLLQKGFITLEEYENTRQYLNGLFSRRL